MGFRRISSMGRQLSTKMGRQFHLVIFRKWEISVGERVEPLEISHFIVSISISILLSIQHRKSNTVCCNFIMFFHYRSKSAGSYQNLILLNHSVPHVVNKVFSIKEIGHSWSYHLKFSVCCSLSASGSLKPSPVIRLIYF